MKAIGLPTIIGWSFAAWIGACDRAPSKAEAIAACVQHVERDACEAQEGCSLFDGLELRYENGTCEQLTTDGGVCYPTGELVYSTAPAELYNLESGRVFSFANDPAVSEEEGWAPCACSDGEPEACGCSPLCQPQSPEGGSSGETR